MSEVTACQEAAQIVCREYFSSVDMALRSYNTYLKKRGAEQATLTQINRYLQSAVPNTNMVGRNISSGGFVSACINAPS